MGMGMGLGLVGVFIDSSFSSNSQICQLVDEFDDVTYHEKQFMKVWNRFIFFHHVYSDGQLPTLCRQFAKECAPQLEQQHLRTAWLLHLLSMWEWSLVDEKTVSECMKIYDENKQHPKVMAMESKQQ